MLRERGMSKGGSVWEPRTVSAKGSLAVQLRYLSAFLKGDVEELEVLEGRRDRGYDSWYSYSFNLAVLGTRERVDWGVWSTCKTLITRLERVVSEIAEGEGLAYVPYVYVVFRPSYAVVEDGRLKEVEAAATGVFDAKVVRIYLPVLEYPRKAVETILHELRHVNDIENRQVLAPVSEGVEADAESFEKNADKYISLYTEKEVQRVAGELASWVVEYARKKINHPYYMDIIELYSLFHKEMAKRT